MSFKLGDRVITENNGKGVIAFIGTTQFAEGEWNGLILDEPRGKNNGSVQDVAYFECEPGYGLFVPTKKLRLEKPATSTTPARPQTRSQASKLRAPTSKLTTPASTPGISPAESVEQLKVSPPQQPTTSAPPPKKEAPSGLKQPSSVTPAPIDIKKPADVVEAAPASPSVKERAQKIMEEPAPTTQNCQVVVEEPPHEKRPSLPPPPTLPPGISEGTEVDILRYENKDLKEKMETLRMRRQDDREKLKELDKVKMQLQVQLDSRQRMMEQLQQALAKLAEKEREIDELTQWRVANHDLLANHSEDLELAHVEKQILEQRVETLEAELDEVRGQADLAQTELEILKEEMAEGTTADGQQQQGGIVNSVQARALQEQIEKLTAACIALRDVNGNLKGDNQTMGKQLDELRQQNTQLLMAAEIAKKGHDEAEKRNLGLKEQLDALVESQDMVDALTMKICELEEQKMVIEDELADMTAIHDMDVQILETHVANEKDFLRDIAEREHRIQELNQKLFEEGTHAENLSSTILRFKKRVEELNEQLQEMKDQELRYQEALNNRGEDKAGKLAGIVSELQTSQGKSFAQMVDSSVRAIELEYAGKQINYLRAFLPDNFTKAGGDGDSVLLSTVFPRVWAKAQLLARLVDERFPGVPGGMRLEHVTKSHKAEQWAQAARIRSLTAGIATLAAQFESALQLCSMDVLAKISEKQPDVSNQEKTLDNYIDLLKQGRLDENSSLDGLKKIATCFTNIFTVHMASQPYDTTRWTQNTLQQLSTTIGWWRVNAQRVCFFVNGGDGEGTEVVDMTTTFQTTIDECAKLIAAALRVVPAEKRLQLTPQFTDDLSAVQHYFDLLALVYHEAASVASAQSGVDDSEGIDADRIREIFHAAVTKIHGSIQIDNTFHPLQQWLSTLRETLTTIRDTLDSGRLEADPLPKQPYPPVLERAMLRKQAAADAEGLKWQIEKKEATINELKKMLKERQDDISNYKLRLEMAEKRVESSGKVEGVKAQHWEQKYEQLHADAKKRETELDHQIRELNQEVEALHRENGDLKERTKAMSRNALLHGMKTASNFEMSSVASASRSSADRGPISGSTPASSIEFHYMQQQVVDLQKRLHYATADLRRLEAEKASLSCGASLRVPMAVAGRCSLEHYAHTDGLEKQLKAIFDEAMELKKDEIPLEFFKCEWTTRDGQQQQNKEQWRTQRRTFMARANALRNRFIQLAKQLEYRDVEIDAIVAGFPILTPEPNASPARFAEICKKWGIPTAA
ncbi:unnamed protein product, partial [Mesorhabditis spiculigera]